MNQELLQDLHQKNYQEFYEKFSKPPLNQDSKFFKFFKLESGPVIIDGIPLPEGPQFTIIEKKEEELVEYVEVDENDFYIEEE